ncbi:hypothetical protein D5086_030513 [Populus alba]|uniref:Uncharacterized protein n=1 Tax=Populus alba TaxID=43335 RepID=A0ACC4APN8_POPAL
MQNPVRGNHVHKEEDNPVRQQALQPLLFSVIHSVLFSFSLLILFLLAAGRWLDLLSGTGSVGIEAINRGCSQRELFSDFQEKDPAVSDSLSDLRILSCLKGNLCSDGKFLMYKDQRLFFRLPREPLCSDG